MAGVNCKGVHLIKSCHATCVYNGCKLLHQNVKSINHDFGDAVTFVNASHGPSPSNLLSCRQEFGGSHIIINPTIDQKLCLKGRA